MGDTDQTFDDIIRGMQHAVNTAQETLRDYQFRMMTQYFRQDDQSGAPYTHRITLSDGRMLEIPTITLVPQSLLAIEELEMAFKLQVTHTEVKNHAEHQGQDKKDMRFQESERSSFHVMFARGASGTGSAEGQASDSGTMSVNIKFKSMPIPEGAARVLDALNMDIKEILPEKGK
jgi:hypothetical protein